MEELPPAEHKIPEIPKDVQKKLEKLKDKLDIFKKKVLAKYSKEVLGITLLPPEPEPPKNLPPGTPEPPKRNPDEIPVLVLLDDALKDKEHIVTFRNRLAESIDKIAVEISGSIATLTPAGHNFEAAITFTASAQSMINKGWMQIYPYKIEESKLPEINGKVKIDKIRFEEKETQPPNRYTPASLVSILEKKNLGTKATRSGIVETLFDRGYLEGQSIKATPLGIRLIESLEKYSSIIIDENLTRKLEEEMEQIQNSQEKGKDLEKKEKETIDSAKKIILDISKEFKVNEIKIGQELLKGLEILRAEQQKSNTLMPCPTCKKGNLRIMYSKKSRRYFVACSAYPECTQTFSLPPNSLIKKSDKICEADNFPKLLAIRKGKRPWEFCFNPDCPVEKAKREKWQATKNKNSEAGE